MQYGWISVLYSRSCTELSIDMMRLINPSISHPREVVIRLGVVYCMVALEEAEADLEVDMGCISEATSERPDTVTRAVGIDRDSVYFQQIV
jgi:hypothetical protein